MTPYGCVAAPAELPNIPQNILSETNASAEDHLNWYGITVNSEIKRAFGEAVFFKRILRNISKVAFR